jgi:uncharacterized membrane protein YbaN (DUF454 family)
LIEKEFGMSELPPLHPMTVGDILDQTFTLYRKHFKTLLGISAVVNVPVIILQTLGLLSLAPVFSSSFGAPSRAPTPRDNPFDNMDPNLLAALVVGFVGFLGIFVLVTAIAYIFQQAALALAVSETYLGRTLTVLEAYRRALRRWQPLLFTTLLFVVGTVVWLPLFLIMFIVIPCLGGLAFLFVSALLFVRLAFTWQAIMLENTDGLGGLRRSWQLVGSFTAQPFWRVVGILLLLVGFAIAFLPSPILGVVFNTVFTNLISLVVTPLSFTAQTLLYYDLRIRNEGFDLQLLAQQLDTPGAP